MAHPLLLCVRWESLVFAGRCKRGDGNMEETIALTYTVEQEDDQYVSRCTELDVASCGDSIEDALRHLHDAVTVYLDVASEDGEIRQLLRERGIPISQRLEADYNVRVHPGVLATIRHVTVASA